MAAAFRSTLDPSRGAAMITSDQVSALIAYLGLLCQLGGALLLVTLFFLLRVHAKRRGYFRIWSRAWLALAAALAALVLFYTQAARVGGPPTWELRALFFVYQGNKLLFFTLLFGGCLSYGVGLSWLAMRARVLAGVGVYAALSVWFSPSLDYVVLWQAPVASLLLWTCTATLLRLPPSRATLGSRATGVFFGLLALLWSMYTVAFAYDAADHDPANVTFLGMMAQHNSYIDLLLMMLLGYGMVVLLMEDVKSETDAAHAQLAVAHDQLKRVALYDSLTGTLNRRAFAEGVGIEAVRARFGAAVMLDMDNLKTVNDSLGHAAGDDLLRHAAETLRTATRPTDRLYRWGGDEFLLLLPGARCDTVLQRLEDFIAAENARHPGCARRSLHLSMGAADYNGAEDLAAAIEHADRDMYADKTRRRIARTAAPPAIEA
jgi:diguanylate cyclase (GGDEF)-like protein